VGHPPSSLSGSKMRIQHRQHLDKIAALSVTVLGVLSFFFWWPMFAASMRFVFLCCFPVIFPFGYALAHPGKVFQSTKMRRVLGIVLGIHCVLLIALLVSLKTFPLYVTLDNPDFVFGFMAVETAAMVLVVRFVKPKSESG